MPQVINISLLYQKYATRGITITRHMDPHVLPMLYVCPHDHMDERDPEGSEDRWPTILLNSDIQGFWWYNTSVLLKWSTPDWSQHQSISQGRHQIPLDIWLASLRDWEDDWGLIKGQIPQLRVTASQPLVICQCPTGHLRCIWTCIVHSSRSPKQINSFFSVEKGSIDLVLWNFIKL